MYRGRGVLYIHNMVLPRHADGDINTRPFFIQLKAAHQVTPILFPVLDVVTAFKNGTGFHEYRSNG